MIAIERLAPQPMEAGLLDDAANMSWWWLSFVDPDRPKGDRNLGAAIVPGFDQVSAVNSAWCLGCNPGGEVAMHPLKDEFVPDAADRCRLLSSAEAKSMVAEWNARP